MKRALIILAVFTMAVMGFSSCTNKERCWKVTFRDKNTEIIMYRWCTKSAMQTESAAFNQECNKYGGTCAFVKANKYGTKENCLAQSPSDEEWEAFYKALTEGAKE